MDSNIYEIDRDISKIVKLINIPKFNGKTAQERYNKYTQKACEAMAVGDHAVAENHHQQADYYRRIMNHPNHYIAGNTEEPSHPTITPIEQLIASTAKYIAKRKEERKAARAEKAATEEAAAKAKADQAEGILKGAETREANGNLAQGTDQPCKIISFRPIASRFHVEKNSAD